MTNTGGGDAGSSSWVGWFFGAVGTIWAILQSISGRRESSAKREGKQEGAAEVEQKRLDEQKEREQRRVEEQKERADERDDNLRDEIRRLRDQQGKLFDKLDAVVSQGVELQTNQNLTNAMTAKALESIAAKQDKHADQLADHAATLRLLNNIVTLLQQQMTLLQQAKTTGTA